MEQEFQVLGKEQNEEIQEAYCKSYRESYPKIHSVLRGSRYDFDTIFVTIPGFGAQARGWGSGGTGKHWKSKRRNRIENRIENHIPKSAKC